MTQGVLGRCTAQAHKLSCSGMTVPTSVRVAFETARLRLAEMRNEDQQTRTSAYRAACKQSAQTLLVERVSIWFLNDEEESISCVLRYCASTDAFDSGQQLERNNCASYFEALHSRRVIAATDALTDPKTRDLLNYLKAEGVGALLDAPIYRDGRVIGVVCHEHLGGPRAWTEREAGFASAVADLLTILIQQAERADLRAAIDAQRQLETQAQKMEALVRLARVVTHDLNNVLTIASLRAAEMGSDPAITSASNDIVEVLSYGGKLLSQLRDFCDQREAGGDVEAVAFLRGMEPSLRSLLGKSIRFRLDCGVTQATLNIPPIELEQLVLNLCMNARDAIKQEGEVNVKLFAVEGGVCLEVNDTGSGMDEATQVRLFEPFYSTKSGHSGIGLAAVYGIIERARGRVEVASSLGTGSTFRITLPPRAQAAGLEPPWGF
jgi:two-component system, cell cycle sensor histidine kinase and response regulator CckA